MVAIIRILVVDDSVVLRNMIVRMSQSLEYEVVGLACDGVEAIEQYKKLRPDVVTMDMSMPKLNGLEALKTILAYDALAKIIVVSAVNQKKEWWYRLWKLVQNTSSLNPLPRKDLVK